MADIVVGRNQGRFFAEEFVLFGEVMDRVDAIAAERDELPAEVTC